MNKLKWLLKEFIIFLVFGITYALLEILARGYTHPTMIVLGGICGVLVGLLNDGTPDMPILVQCLLGSIIITVLEFVSGCYLNLYLGLNIWDYSNLAFNLLGQVSLKFTIIWFILSVPVIYLDDYMKSKLKLL